MWSRWNPRLSAPRTSVPSATGTPANPPYRAVPRSIFRRSGIERGLLSGLDEDRSAGPHDLGTWRRSVGRVLFPAGVGRLVQGGADEDGGPRIVAGADRQSTDIGPERLDRRGHRRVRDVLRVRRARQHLRDRLQAVEPVAGEALTRGRRGAFGVRLPEPPGHHARADRRDEPEEDGELGSCSKSVTSGTNTRPPTRLTSAPATGRRRSRSLPTGARRSLGDAKLPGLFSANTRRTATCPRTNPGIHRGFQIKERAARASALRTDRRSARRSVGSMDITHPRRSRTTLRCDPS